MIDDLAGETLDDMRAELAGYLGVETSALPPVFAGPYVMILKRGIDADLAARYPAADFSSLKDWLARYTQRYDYLWRTRTRAKHRHDLDGNDVEPIHGLARKYARDKIIEKNAVKGAA